MSIGDVRAYIQDSGEDTDGIASEHICVAVEVLQQCGDDNNDLGWDEKKKMRNTSSAEVFSATFLKNK